MSRSKLCLVSVVVALLAIFALNARADTIIDFETPTYAVGDLTGQDGWADSGVPVYSELEVDNTDASSGSQSLQGQGSTTAYSANVRVLNDSYAVGTTSYFSLDIKGETFVIFRDAADARLFQFGIQPRPDYDFYVGGGPGGWELNIDPGPDTARWVTIWAKLYTVAGNQKADVGWCEVTQQPFVDGLLSGYDAGDYVFSKVQLANIGTVARMDNLRVSSVIPEPSMLALLATGLLGLLCYAWRKRK